ncbi:M23 family metallopeptidase [Bailinhaonella thermotolerans]|uniref:M23 family metallopeptidase n=1 Tax=Bailinhaonella thermotolerans TaxID=1070861 RepID=A0A3A4A010_9ACTN|nr:M23 family metallopeptidase [Bailinhaonella thermotolerans]RJL21494.1 M23 family metallopeptidase [Bailinhaonella thermotolerans]
MRTRQRAQKAGLAAAFAGLAALLSACAATQGTHGALRPAAPPPVVDAIAATPVPTPEASPGGVRPSAAPPVKLPPPKLSPHRYVFPVSGCKTSYARRLLVLPKSTIWTGKGCLFVSPIAGRVHEVRAKDRWRPATDKGADREGKFVTVIGVDGVRYLGGHLDSIAEGIKPGAEVRAGQPLGRVGTSGTGRREGPNLYFALSWETDARYWWVRRGMVEPWDYLDAWRNGNRTLSPAPAIEEVQNRVGLTPRCTVLCKDKEEPKQRERPEKEDEAPLPETTPDARRPGKLGLLAPE